MEVFVIAAMSADGFIARGTSEVSTSWTSQEDKKRFVSLTKKARAVVMGRKTFETFGNKPLKDRSLFIYSRQAGKTSAVSDVSDVEWVSLPPADFVKNLSEKGFSSLAVCGGAEIYSRFMETGLVSRIYLTVEPILFGRGIGLFNVPVDRRLVLERTETTEKGTVFLDYRLES